MRLRYEITLEDLVAANRHVLLTSPTMQSNLRKGRIAFAVLVVCVSVVIATYLSRPETQFATVASGLALATLTAVVYKRGITKLVDRNSRRLYSESDSKVILGQQEIELSDDGFVRRSYVSETKLKWTGVDRMEETDRHALWYVAPTTAYVIAKHDVTEGDAEAFLLRARQLWLAANPDAIAVAAET